MAIHCSFARTTHTISRKDDPHTEILGDLNPEIVRRAIVHARRAGRIANSAAACDILEGHCSIGQRSIRENGDAEVKAAANAAYAVKEIYGISARRAIEMQCVRA